MPLTNDELSALHRTNFSDLGSLLREGVTPDAHPALTQVFLWLWVKAAGTSAWLLRLPFVAAGIASIAIIHRLALHAFDRHTGLLAAAFMAGSQILVYFSDTARPYAFGMLICTALALYWFRCVFDEQHKVRNHLWMALLLALSVYNHYFSGLLGILIWLSGWVFVGRIHKGYYFGGAVLAFILFLPHLSISLTQLGHKGVGSWLRPPAPDFLWEWFMSLINYSKALLIPIAVLVALKIRVYVLGKQLPGFSRAIVFAAWFAVSYVIGHAWSLLIDPLLHHGALLFATPFFCLAMAFILAPRSGFLAKAAAYTITAILVYSLVWQRNHFEVFEQQPYAKVAEQIKSMDEEGAEALAVIQLNPAYLDRYIDVDTLKNTRVINLAEKPLSTAELMPEIKNEAVQRLYLDGRNWSLCRGAQEIRKLEMRTDGFTYTGHHFRQRKANNAPTADILIDESTEIQSFHSEFLEVYKVGLDTATFGFADHAAAVFRFHQADSSLVNWPETDLHLVFSFNKNGKPFHYSSAVPSGQGFAHRDSYVLVHQLLLWDLFINYREMEGVELKVYLWNPEMLDLNVAGWEVIRVAGNPNLYSQLNRRP